VGRIVSVNVGPVRDRPGAPLGRTGIENRAVAGPESAKRQAQVEDEHDDLVHHGGVDQAVYAFAREDLDRWEAELGYELRPGQFGENLTTSGVDLNAAVIGERWLVGSVQLEVSCPRVPCATFAEFLGEPAWVKRFTANGRVGTYLRVIVEGELTAGQDIEVVHRPGHGITVGLTFAARTLRRELLPRLLEAPELPVEWHDRARRWVADPTHVG
jgi:MOSC domain-containing protein YiiM